MTSRLERLIPKIEDQFFRSFLEATDDRDSAAGHYTVPSLETLAEKIIDLERRAHACEGRRT